MATKTPQTTKTVDEFFVSMLANVLDGKPSLVTAMLKKSGGGKKTVVYYTPTGFLAEAAALIEAHFPDADVGEAISQVASYITKQAVEAATSDAPAPAAPAKSGEASLAEAIFSRLPPANLTEAVKRFAATPADIQSQNWLTEMSGGVAIIVEASSGVVDEAATLAVALILQEESEAPTEWNGRDVLSVSQFLNRTNPGCPITRKRLVGGKPLGVSGISYGWVGDIGTLAAAERNEVMRLICFAVSEGFIRRGDVASGKARLNELRRELSGQEISSQKEIRALLDGTEWESVCKAISLDARSGSPKMKGALALLIAESGTQRRSTTTASGNGLTGAFDAMSQAFTGDRVRTSDGGQATRPHNDPSRYRG